MKITQWENKYKALEKRRDYWKEEYEKYNHFWGLILDKFLCEGCNLQETHEGVTVEVCRECNNKLHVLGDAREQIESCKRTIERQKIALTEHVKQISGLRLDVALLRQAHDTVNTKYLTLLRKVQCDNCKRHNSFKLCSDCLKSVDCQVLAGGLRVVVSKVLRDPKGRGRQWPKRS